MPLSRTLHLDTTSPSVAASKPVPAQDALPRDIPALTGIRGIAAIGVVFFHFCPTFAWLFPGVHRLDWLTTRGDAAVPLFFLLSGFILAHVYDPLRIRLESGSFGSFLKHRLFRIYPLYLITLLLYAGNVWLRWPPPELFLAVYTWPHFIANLLLIQSFPLVPVTSWNVPSWSISVEMFAYLFAFPGGCWLLRRFPFSRGAKFAAMFLAIALAAFVVEMHLFHSNSGSIAQGCLLFLAGMFLHGAARGGSVSPWWNHSATAALLTALPVFWLGNHAVGYEYMVAICPVLLLSCLDRQSLLGRFCTWPAILFSGELSYSIYLNHGVVEAITWGTVNPHLLVGASWIARIAWIAVVLCGTFGMSLLTYFFIEKASRRWLRKKFG